MDDRRRTISSEEQIGEALMRVSNTLEAQRLTKSLEYQEKLRRRTAFRMVLSIILAIVMVASLVVGGLLFCTLEVFGSNSYKISSVPRNGAWRYRNNMESSS